jgi:hypothetical protein
LFAGPIRRFVVMTLTPLYLFYWAISLSSFLEPSQLVYGNAIYIHICNMVHSNCINKSCEIIQAKLNECGRLTTVQMDQIQNFIQQNTPLIGSVIVVIAAGIIWLMLIVMDSDYRRELGAKGLHIQGVVIHLDDVHDPEAEHKAEAQRNTLFGDDPSRSYFERKRGLAGERFFVTYRYEVNGRTFRRREQVSKRAFETLWLNSNIDVLYLPDQPGNARLTVNIQ